MKTLREYRARAALCRQLALGAAATRAHWLAEAERWTQLERDEIAALFAACNDIKPAADAPDPAKMVPPDAGGAKLRVALCSGLLALLLAPALADQAGTGARVAPFSYRSTGTCLASPAGFNARLEPVNTGIAWTTTFTALGRVDERGMATESGQAVDTASFGVGPRMHTPAAHAYDATFTAILTEPADDGRVTLRAGPVSGTFTAGPFSGQGFTLSAFELHRIGNGNGGDAYAGASSPVMQTVTLTGGIRFERICVWSVSTTPQR